MYAIHLDTAAGRRWWDGQSWGSKDRAAKYHSQSAALSAVARARGAGIGFDLRCEVATI